MFIGSAIRDPLNRTDWKGRSIMFDARISTPQQQRAKAAPPLPAFETFDMARETNHRLANSLQLLSAMVAMTARTVADSAAQAVLAETYRRIDAIGKLHRHLYSTRDGCVVDLAEYLLELGEYLESGYCDAKAKRRVLVDVDSIPVVPDNAQAIGILVSELVGNACKYAYEPGMPGDIRIVLRSSPAGGYRLVVEDRGIGQLAKKPAQGTGLGLRFIEVMTARLRGQSIWQDARPGTRFLLSVPD